MLTDELAHRLRFSPLPELGRETWDAADRLLSMDEQIRSHQNQLDELRKWAILLAGNRCECANVFTATGVQYTQCAPCAFRESVGLQEPEPTE